MMIKKPFGKKVLSIILVIVIAITPFSYTKADTYTIDDVYLKLRDILTVLNGYGQNIPTEGINDQIQDLQDLFDTIFVDNTYSYVGVTGTVEYRTFMDLMEVIASMGYTIPAHIMEGYWMRDSNGILVHMAGVNENIAAVLNKLNLLNSSSSTIISDLQSIISQTASILSTLNTVSTTLTSILAVDNNILNLETNFYNYIQNGTFKYDLDDAIDTISWRDYGSLLGYTTNLNNPISSITSSTVTGRNFYFVYSINPATLKYYQLLLKVLIPLWCDDDLHFKIYFGSINNDIITLSNSQITLDTDVFYYYRNNNYPLFNYLIINDFGNWISQNNIIIHFYADSTIYMRDAGINDFGLKYLSYDDIEAWQIRETILLNRLVLDYESVNSSELDKLKQDNQQFNTTLQNFNNLENQISTDFSNNLVTFNSNLTESTTMFNSLTNTVVWFSNQMQNIFNVSSDFKMLLIMPMVLGIALWFIGRGSFILRSSGKKGKENNKS